MGKDKEPLDALIGRPALGIHQVAAAVIMAPSSNREEHDLASQILRRNPEQSAPRENETSVEAFNRILDVAIDSANESACCGTRAERRSRLSADLGRASVILIDSSKLAEFIGAKLELDALKLAAEKPEPGPAPLLDLLVTASATCSSTAATAFATVAASAIAGITSADDLGSELYSSELSNDGSIEVGPIAND